MGVVLTDAGKHRFATFVFHLLTVERSMQANERTNRKTHRKKKTNKVRDRRGPCCLEQLIYNGVIDLGLQWMIAMIDTIVMTLSSDMFKISDPDCFKPSARWFCNTPATLHGIQSKQNPTKKDLHNGIYKPRLLLSHRITASGKREIMLKIEVSLPKLMFGNNFDELQYKYFLPITNKLSAILASMGVIATAESLAQAPLYSIHYSKNILLTDGSTPYHYLQKIKEANIKLSLDVNQTDYRNEGHCYKWHSNSYEVVFYDKIKDLEQAYQSDKRAVEKDSTLQLALLGAFAKRHKREILRMEIRLNRRKKIRQLCATLNVKTDLTFKSLYKPAIAKKMLLHYLDILESKRPSLLDYKAKSDLALLAALIVNNPELPATRIMQMFGLKKTLEIVNIRELRGMLRNCNASNWYRLMADVNKLNLPGLQSPFWKIREQLEVFKPLRI